MKNYDETIDTVFRRMSEYKTAKKRRNAILIRIAVPVCCLMMLVGLWMFRPAPPAVTPPDPQVPTTTCTDSFLVATDPVPENLDVVIVNPIYTVPNTNRMNIALMLDDFIPMNQEELCDYYGTNVFPTVPEDLSCTDKDYGIFRRQGGTGEIYWDGNYISYYNADDSRSVVVNVDSGMIPVDFCNLFDEPQKRSTINGVPVGIGKTDHGAFYAEFLFNDTGFRVLAEGLEKEEFIDILRSLTA